MPSDHIGRGARVSSLRPRNWWSGVLRYVDLVPNSDRTRGRLPVSHPRGPTRRAPTTKRGTKTERECTGERETGTDRRRVGWTWRQGPSRIQVTGAGWTRTPILVSLAQSGAGRRGARGVVCRYVGLGTGRDVGVVARWRRVWRRRDGGPPVSVPGGEGSTDGGGSGGPRCSRGSRRTTRRATPPSHLRTMSSCVRGCTCGLVHPCPVVPVDTRGLEPSGEGGRTVRGTSSRHRRLPGQDPGLGWRGGPHPPEPGP